MGIIFVRDDYIITVSLKEQEIIQFYKRKNKNLQHIKKSRFILQLMYKNASSYLNYLKQINKETEAAELRLKESMKNQELLKLLDLENLQCIL